MADKLTPDACFELLARKSIRDRAEGARELALVGTLQHIESLMEIAQTDKSPAVRLGCAGAAADILSRHRTGHARRKLPMPEREKILSIFRALDPGVNPGLFAVIATLDLPRSLDRIMVGLRDPRYDVRQGAAVGLLRYCSSSSVAKNARVPKKVIDLLGDQRTPADVLAGIMRVCVACGWQQARGAIEQYLDRGDQVGTAAEECLALLEEQNEPAFLLRGWMNFGIDAGEVNPKARPERTLFLGDGRVLEGVEGGDYEIRTWSLTEQGDIVVGEDEPQRLRRMWLSLPGQEPSHAIQTVGETWYAASPEAVIASVQEWRERTAGASKKDRKAMGAILLSTLPENPAGQQAAAWVAIACGRGKDAVTGVELLLKEGKKPSPDLLWLLALAQDVAGDKAGAEVTCRKYLRRAGAKGKHAAEAKARLGR